MATRKPATGLIQGHATHRRTESDYMSMILDTVTLDDWRDVVSGALTAAKGGDAKARDWLGQYLVGQASWKAQTPLTVVVNQLSGHDALVNKLATPLIHARTFGRDDDDLYKLQITQRIKDELTEKISTATTDTASVD